MAAAADTLKAVDLYCGGGGTSSGLMEACEDMDLDVDLIAINHWDTAIATHSKNHPRAKHLCTNIDNLDPLKVVPGRYLHLLVASPECTHHSIARGGRPVNDQLRASAWHILRWAEALYIENILIENVKEFRDWGPVGKDSKPMKRLKGKLFIQFLDSLRNLGYKVDWRILNAANYGDATTRERLFIMARRNPRKSICWPEPTHAPAGQTAQAELYGKKKPWRAAREIIDWSLEGEDIFTRNRPLADNTLRRIFAGLEKFGGDAAKPFLVILRGTGGSRDLEKPLPTVTAQGNHFGLVEPLPAFMLGQQSGSAPRSVEHPVPTIATGGAISVCEPYIFAMDHTGSNSDQVRAVGEPLSSVTSKQRHAICEPFIVGAGGPQRAGEPQSVEKPLGTVLTRNTKAVIEPFIIPQFGEQGPRSVDVPLGTVTTTSRGVGLAEPYLVSVNHGNQEGNGDERRVHDIKRPLPAVTTKNGYALVETEVSPEPFLTKYYSAATSAQSVDEPLDTVTTKPRFGLVQPVVNGMRLEIRFRMLQPHELAAAQSFAKDYKFSGNKSEVTKQIGNAVPVQLARALIRELLK